jgi:crotonobetainyl-CoA hydratase
MSEYLHVTKNGQILEVVLDNPKANAIGAVLSREMGQVFAEFRDDPTLRVAILTGAGEKFFCGGWDLNAVDEGEDYLEDFGEGGFGGYIRLPGLLKPVICAVNGYALGAGFEMLLATDFVVAAEHAQFWLPEVQRGIPTEIATFLLPKMLPRQKAMELLLTGRRMGASELAALGLVNSVVPADQLMDSARVLAQDLMRGAPLALEAVKEAVHMTEKLNVEESFDAMHSKSWPAFTKALESSDAQEGVKAFLEGREPDWKGC